MTGLRIRRIRSGSPPREYVTVPGPCLGVRRIRSRHARGVRVCVSSRLLTSARVSVSNSMSPRITVPTKVATSADVMEKVTRAEESKRHSYCRSALEGCSSSRRAVRVRGQNRQAHHCRSDPGQEPDASCFFLAAPRDRRCASKNGMACLLRLATRAVSHVANELAAATAAASSQECLKKKCKCACLCRRRSQVLPAPASPAPPSHAHLSFASRRRKSSRLRRLIMSHLA